MTPRDMLAELARKAAREGLTPIEEWAVRELRRRVRQLDALRDRYRVDPEYREQKRVWRRSSNG